MGRGLAVPTARSRLGAWGEQVAGRFLQDRGYRILATNYRCVYGEVDIVAQEDDELVFVEVRTRRVGNYGTPEESLSKPKLRRLVATCHHYLQRQDAGAAQWRVDLVSVYLQPGRVRRLERINHLRHAVAA